MINIHDSILPILLELSRPQLLIYMLINRYLTEDLDIPIDHVQTLSKLTHYEFFNALSELERVSAFTIKTSRDPDELDSVFIELDDPINEKAASFTCKKSAALLLYYNLIVEYKNLVNNEEDRNKNIKTKDAKREKLSKAEIELQLKITKRFKKGLTKLHNRIVKNDANKLVDRFADCQLKLYPDLRLSDPWRKRQFATAQKILKHYSYEVKIWIECIELMEKNEFWQDKLSNLVQVEKNIHQLMVNKKKKASRKKTTIRKI